MFKKEKPIDSKYAQEVKNLQEKLSQLEQEKVFPAQHQTLEMKRQFREYAIENPKQTNPELNLKYLQAQLKELELDHERLRIKNRIDDLISGKFDKSTYRDMMHDKLLEERKDEIKEEIKQTEKYGYTNNLLQEAYGYWKRDDHDKYWAKVKAQPVQEAFLDESFDEQPQTPQDVQRQKDEEQKRNEARRRAAPQKGTGKIQPQQPQQPQQQTNVSTQMIQMFQKAAIKESARQANSPVASSVKIGERDTSKKEEKTLQSTWQPAQKAEQKEKSEEVKRPRIGHRRP